MIRTLRAFFLARLLREKILLVGFAAIGVLIWGSAFSGRARRFWQQKNATTAELRNQQHLLDNRARIEAAAQKAAAQFEPEKTLDSVRLYATVLQLAKDAGISGRSLAITAPPPPVTIGQFSVNSLVFVATVGSTKADWLMLENFYAALQDKAPYIGIDQFTLGIRGNPPQHYLQLKISSFESVP